MARDGSPLRPCLYLHILGTVIAFGPTWAFPIIGGLGSREPQHGNFALRLSLALEDRLVLPLALSLAITGVGLMVTASPSISITEAWLLAGIALYVVALVLALAFMRPTVLQLVKLTLQPPQVPAGATPAGGAPSAPPPAFPALITRQQRMGIALTVLFLLILLLMIFQPGGAGHPRGRASCARCRHPEAQAGSAVRRVNARGLDGLVEAVGLAERHGLSVYDAVYLQLALDTEAGPATQDRALALAARAEGLVVHE